MQKQIEVPDRPSFRHFLDSEDTVDAMYAHYEARLPNPRVAKAGLWLCGRLLKPQVEHTDARALTRFLDEGGVVIIAPNHRGIKDSLAVAGSVGIDPILQPIGDRARILSNVNTFKGKMAGRKSIPPLDFILTPLGAIPTVRKQDDPSEVGDHARLCVVETSAHLVADRQNLVMFPEGTWQRDPDTAFQLLPLRPGIGRIATQAADRLYETEEAESGIAILTAALVHPDGGGVIFKTGELIPVSPEMDAGELVNQTEQGMKDVLSSLEA